MRIFMYLAGLTVGTIIGALAMLIIGFFIDHKNQ